MRWRSILECAVLLGLLICASPIEAQTVQQSGSVTPGHAVKWTTTGVVSDGGTASNGLLTSLGVTASGPGICQQSGPNTGALNRVCLNATSTGGGISMTNVGGATGGFTFTLNGVTQGMGTVTLPVTPGDFACFADSSGTLQDCGGTLTNPAGSNTQVQFNAAGVFGASPNLTWVSPALSIGAASSATGQLKMVGTTSGAVTIQSQAAAGTYNFNLPTSAGTSGQCLKSAGGGSSAQTYGECISGTLAQGNIFVGNASNVATATPTPVLGVAGTTLGTIALSGNTSGTVTLRPPAVAGSSTITLAPTVNTELNIDAAFATIVRTPDTPVTKATLQAAIDEVAAIGGGIVQIPAGVWTIDTSAGCVSISTGAIIVQGEGADTTTGSVLSTNNAANDLFCVTTIDYVLFRDFGITSSVVRNSGTAGINVDDASSGNLRSKKVIERMRIDAQYNAINIADATQVSISDNVITNPVGSGIIITQPDVIDQGAGTISRNNIWCLSGCAATAGIIWHRGSGLRVHNNRILGAFDYGLWVQFDKTFGGDGVLLVTNNLFEIQDLYGIYMERTAAAQAAGKTIGQLVITGNHVQALTSGYQNAIAIESSTGGGWVRGANIIGNVIQNLVAAPLNNAMIRIDDGDRIRVSSNYFDYNPSGDGGVRVAGNATNVMVDNNQFAGGTAALRYPSINSTTILIDLNGLPFANLPSSGNGSQIYVSDGTAGSPVTGSGSGVMAFRTNSSWKSAAYVDSINVWTAQNAFTINQSAATTIQVNNNSTGTAALAALSANNASNNAGFGIGGTGYTGLGSILQNRAYIDASGSTAGIIFNNEGNNPLIISRSNAEIARFPASGGNILNLGTNATGVGGLLGLYGSTSGLLSIKAAATAGTNTLTFPAGTTDFSATGGTSQVVKQTSAGGAFTVARLACADLSDSGAGCAGSSGIIIGTTTITSGTTTRILYDNGGVVGEYTLTGSGTVVAMQTAPTFVTSITAPAVFGGTAVGSSLVLQSTSGAGTTDFIDMLVGNNGATRGLRVVNSGQVVLGNTAAVSTNKLEVSGAADAGMFFGRYQNVAGGAGISLIHSRNATVGSHTIVQSGDSLGNILWYGSDGTQNVQGAGIQAIVDGTPGTNDMPTRLSFQVTPDAGSASVEAQRIGNAGTVYFPLVGTTASAANAFLDSGSTPVNQLLRSTSSMIYKTAIRDLTTRDVDVVMNLHPFTYSSLAKADDPDRRHFGFAAEEVAELDPRLVNYLGDKPDGVQYERIIVPMVAVIQKLKAANDNLVKRVDALERRSAAGGKR